MKSLKQLLKSDSIGAFLLFIAGVFALILANSSASGLYEHLLQTFLKIQLGDFKIEKPLVFWINDGLMAIFFLLVGLEIKRECLKGALNDKATAILPALGALGGVLLPALIYLSMNHSDPIAIKGWGIPVATDIAFSLGALSLLGKRIPNNLKIFLAALAIIDDIAAIIIIAIFYTSDLSLFSLLIAVAALLVLLIMNVQGVRKLSPYILVGIILWLSVLKSGIHATLSGIILAMTIPLRKETPDQDSPLESLENKLLPWVTLLVLPLFAFANSGFSMSGMTRDIVFHPTVLGIVFGLLVGKQLGIFGSCWLMVRLKLGKLPEGINWLQFWGMSILCGIGFTMSIFIGTLAFENDDLLYTKLLRLGVIVGSMLSAMLGLFILNMNAKKVSDC